MRIYGLFTLVLLSSACAVEGAELENAEHEDVDASIAPLNGDLITEGCSSPQRTKLLQAFSILKNELGPTGRFATCMTNAMLTWTNNSTAEAIVRRMKEDMPTRVRCVPDGWCGGSALACASHNLPDERVNIEVDYLDGVGAESAAATIAHEVSHNKGFTHPASGSSRVYDFTVPEQIEHCINSFPDPTGHPKGIERPLVPRETELSMIGGGGGYPFELSCGSCEFARGFRVDSSATNINRMAMHCDSTTTPSVGELKDSTHTARPDRCHEGEVAVGFMSSSGTMVNSLILICQSETSVIDGITTGGRVLPLGGQFSGPDNVTRRCPKFMALKRVYGRAGARIDQMRLVCETFVGPKQGVPHNLPILGTATGATERRQCLGNGAIVALGGRANAELDALFSTCTITTNHFNGGIVADTTPTFANKHILDEVGGTGGIGFEDFCPQHGQMLVGLRARAGQRIDQIRGVCAFPREWATLDAPAPTELTPKRGGETGIPAERMCARGEFLTGMQTWTSTVPGRTPSVFGIMPICRRMNYPHPTAPLPMCTE